jgi:hypothetical protein
MSMTTPIEPLQFEQHWFYPRLFPKASVILLDGATGVGKSMFCAHLASRFAQGYQGDKQILTLFITSSCQTITRNRHLGHQQATGRFIANANFNDCFQHYQDQGNGVYNTILEAFETWLNKLLAESKPLVVILDDFEEMVEVLNEKLSKHQQAEWWSILRYAAIQHCCSFIVPRRKGMNLPRHYGSFNTAGTEYTDFILTMHWHPHDPKKRVISIAKNNHGPIGMQWHFHFDPLGATSLHEMEDHQHVRPSKVPQTWKADPALVNRINQVAEEIKEYMGNQDKPIAEMREHLRAKEFSSRVIDDTIGRMRIEHTKVDTTWCYQPSQAMWVAIRRKELDTARLQQAGLNATSAEAETPTARTRDTKARTHDAEVGLLPTPSTLAPEGILDLRTHEVAVAA